MMVFDLPAMPQYCFLKKYFNKYHIVLGILFYNVQVPFMSAALLESSDLTTMMEPSKCFLKKPHFNLISIHF